MMAFTSLSTLQGAFSCWKDWITLKNPKSKILKSLGEHTPLRFIITCDRSLLPYIISHRWNSKISFLNIHNH